MSHTTPQLLLRVTPSASRDGLGGVWEGPDGTRRLIVHVTAPPEKGKANKAVIALLAKQLGVPKSTLSVVIGQTDRNKTVRIEADYPKAARDRLWAEVS